MSASMRALNVPPILRGLAAASLLALAGTAMAKEVETRALFLDWIVMGALAYRS